MFGLASDTSSQGGPAAGGTRTKTQMAIEQQTQAATWTDSADDLSGTGQDWSWCTP